MFSVRLVEQAAQGEGWEGAGVREAVELLPGPHFQHTRGQGAAGSSFVTNPAATVPPNLGFYLPKVVILLGLYAKTQRPWSA